MNANVQPDSDRRDAQGQAASDAAIDAKTSDAFANYPSHPGVLPTGEFTAGRYSARFATSREEVDTLLKLRFDVFNLEMNEGLQGSFETGRDLDPFDPYCHHMLVVDRQDGFVVGTYRMQTYEMASAGAGFYSGGEFDLEGIPQSIRQQSMEVGRACIHADHRNRQVLFLLWQGLAAYVLSTQKRYFFGCSSINSQNPDEGLALHRQLTAAGQVQAEFSTPTLPSLQCTGTGTWPEDQKVNVPALFRTYLRYGAKVCSPPAIDREFKTIDFLVLLDTHSLSERSRKIFFPE